MVATTLPTGTIGEASGADLRLYSGAHMSRASQARPTHQGQVDAPRGVVRETTHTFEVATNGRPTERSLRP